MGQDFLEIRGARVHNLKNVDLRLPNDRLIVFTGVSGSGKSSLVFDTIYAEGQRRYVESLSAYARQFLDRMEKPDVDEIAGISPAVAIRQKNSTRNPRSTVGTATEIYDFLRLLFARAGTTFCDNCGQVVERDSVDQVTETILAQPERSRWYILFPVFAEPEARNDRLTELRARGFNRLYQDGKLVEFSTPESLLELDLDQPFFALVDRIAISPDARDRIAEGTETSYREAREVVFERAGSAPVERVRFSEKFECRNCKIAYEEPTPQIFSFNSPRGACPRCQGFGNTMDYDEDKIIPDRFKSLAEGAVDPWTKPRYLDEQDTLLRHAKRAKVRTEVPYRELNAKERKWLFDGDSKFRGIRGFFAFLETKKYKMHVRLALARYRGYAKCPDCDGGRLGPAARRVKVGGKTIGDVTALTLAEALKFFDSLELGGSMAPIAEQLLTDVCHRLRFLNDVGLDYLSLDRLASTLSGGEAQRIQLATSLGSRLVGACYVLDEPSIGLHSRDTARLVSILEGLRDIGNSILVVEHDAEVMRSADRIVDLGPGAGEHGGEILFEGTPKELLNGERDSLTGKYLRGELRIETPAERRPIKKRRQVVFEGCMAHNLKAIDVALPLDVMTVVTGVSGSGKSTLVHKVIYDSLQGAIDDEDAQAVSGGQTVRKVTGAERVGEVILVDQSPIGRSPRSNPVTYTKAFDAVRELFAATPEAQRRGFTPGAFSFNIPGGRCETCQGDGTVKVEMQFLADVELVCDVCGGQAVPGRRPRHPLQGQEHPRCASAIGQ